MKTQTVTGTKVEIVKTCGNNHVIVKVLGRNNLAQVDAKDLILPEGELPKELAELKSTDVVYDLYSGTGTIAIYLSDVVERVIGIEVVESAIADAERNADINKITNCYFLQGDLKDCLTKYRSWLEDHPQPTVVVADPPRSGMHEKVIKQIIKFSPDRIVYVSCNPATQARDAKLLAAEGYKLDVVQPVDMFPHTDHVEAVALFRKL